MKEMGACGVFVVGGVVYGVSQYGLNDVLSDDLKYISEVSQSERSAYMDSIVAEFQEAFETYTVPTETYTFLGQSHFSTAPSSGTFTETVRQDSPVPTGEIAGLKTVMKAANFCAQDEMTMFTLKGWNYSFRLTDSKGRKIFKIECKPLELRSA